MIGYDETDYFERQEAEVERNYFEKKRKEYRMTAATTLRQIGKDPLEAVPAKPQMILHGEPGVGKTWFALSFPKAYLIDSEGGANLPHYAQRLAASGGKYFGKEDGAGDFDKVLHEVRSLVVNEHDRDTLIIDGMTRLFENTVQQELTAMIQSNASFDPTRTYGAERKLAVAKCRQLMSLISQLDCNVLVICQSAPDYESETAQPKADVHKCMTYDVNLCMEAHQPASVRYLRVTKSRYQQFTTGESFELDYQSFQQKWRGK